MTYLEVFGRRLTGWKATLALCVPMWVLSVILVCCTALGQTTDNRPPPIITVPGTTISPMRLEPWTNGRYIIRDVTGKQIGTVEPYPNGWIVRDRSGRETWRVGK